MFPGTLITALVQEMAKLSQAAKGIPDRSRITPIPSISGATWKMGLQSHDAAHAGLHYDLRLVDPATDIAHSWALPQAALPKPGEKLLAIRQADHSGSYVNWQGTIPAGEYGAGKVTRKRHEDAEIIQAAPDKVKFNLYTGRGPEEFVLLRWRNAKNKETDVPGTTDANRWLILNTTQTKESHPEIPSSKPKYKEIKFKDVDVNDTSTVMMPKLDGSHVTYLLQKDKIPRVFSYRPNERETGVIEHTHKVPGVMESRVPASLDGTLLRGELYAKNKKGRYLDSESVGGMLNAGVWKSRELQKEKGPIKPAIFDVVKFRGKPMENAPYEDKLQALREVAKHLPYLQVPEVAITPTQKTRLLKRIQQGKHQDTKEGVVLWKRNEGVVPTKAKIKHDDDVIVRHIFPGKNRLAGKAAGGFDYSLTPDGPIVGRVGGGLSDSLRKEMWENPHLFVGATARIESLGQFPKSGAYRAPQFVGWHLDNPPKELEKTSQEDVGGIFKKFLPFVDDTVMLGARYGKPAPQKKQIKPVPQGNQWPT